MPVAQACLENIPPDQFWSITDLYLDLVRQLHVQIGLWEILDSMAVFLGLPVLMVNFVFFTKKTLKMSAIFYWTALILEIFVNLFGQT